MNISSVSFSQPINYRHKRPAPLNIINIKLHEESAVTLQHRTQEKDTYHSEGDKVSLSFTNEMESKEYLLSHKLKSLANQACSHEMISKSTIVNELSGDSLASRVPCERLLRFNSI